MTKRVLKCLGLGDDDKVIFLGAKTNVPDLKLSESLVRIFAEFLSIIKSIPSVELIFTHSLEGGHPDHDSAHVLTVSVAKDLGLIDEIGDAHQILREKFGEDVVIKKFEKAKSWLSKKLSSSNDHIDQFANILEEKSVWQKYGL